MCCASDDSCLVKQPLFLRLILAKLDKQITYHYSIFFVTTDNYNFNKILWKWLETIVISPKFMSICSVLKLNLFSPKSTKFERTHKNIFHSIPRRLSSPSLKPSQPTQLLPFPFHINLRVLGFVLPFSPAQTPLQTLSRTVQRPRAIASARRRSTGRVVPACSRRRR
jgi:hypothetical protein